MKRKALGLLLICVIVLMAFTAGCGTKTSGDSTVTIAMSDEAKEYEKSVLAESGDKAYFQEENFDLTMQYVSDRGEQILPACDVVNAKDYQMFEEYNVYTLTGENCESVVLYIHGGAWVFEISDAHVSFCDDLATKLNARVYIPLYPLAPEATGEETYSFLEKLYKEILKEGKTVYVMGDSAGGELALGLMYILKAENIEMPEKVVLMAPCSDMTFGNEEIAELEKTDPELASYGCRKCAELWAGENNLQNPKYSAVYADVTGYPDTLLFQGTNDILCPDNRILVQKLEEAGVNVTLVEGEGLWHVFPVYPIPEREDALERITAFCAK